MSTLRARPQLCPVVDQREDRFARPRALDRDACKSGVDLLHVGGAEYDAKCTEILFHVTGLGRSGILFQVDSKGFGREGGKTILADDCIILQEFCVNGQSPA